MIGRLRELEAEGNTRAAEHIQHKIVDATYPFVVACVGKFYTKNPHIRKFPVEDAIQVGAMAMYHAVDKYQPDKGALTTYARWWIHQAVRRAYHSDTVVHIPEWCWKEPHNRSLNQKIADDNEAEHQDFLEDEAANPEEVLMENDREKITSEMASMIYTLNERQSRVIYDRFVRGKRLREVGEEMGVSRERVRQIEMAALAKLRKKVERRYGKA